MINTYTVDELRKEAKSIGLKGYSKLRKVELYKLVKRYNNIKQVAFCFLLYDTIQHLKIWEDFFNQDHSGTSTIYSHLKTVTNKTPGWIKNSRVKSVRTDWCGEGLINAFSQMLKKALKNPNNKYFVILSGSCIPLYTYNKTYKKITSTKKARISYKNDPEQKDENLKFAHQWVILNRKTALDYIRLSDKKDTKAVTFIKRMRRIFKNNGVSVGNKPAVGLDESIMHCPDEVYPINWFEKLYGKNLNKFIIKQMTTYTLWDFDIDPDHPVTFNKKTAKKYKKKICGKGHIFGRKFNKSSAKQIAMKC